MNVSEEISAYAQVLIPVWQKNFANELDSTFGYYKLLVDIPWPVHTVLLCLQFFFSKDNLLIFFSPHIWEYEEDTFWKACL